MKKVARLILAFKKYMQYKRLRKRLENLYLKFIKEGFYWEADQTKKRLLRVLLIGRKFPKFNFLEKEHRFSLLELFILGMVLQVVYGFFEALIMANFHMIGAFIYIIAVSATYGFLRWIIVAIWKDWRKK